MSDFEKEEKQILNAKTLYNEITIPDQLDDYIRNGLNKSIKNNKKNNFQRKLSIIAASFLLITFVTSVRVSPAFAAYLSKFPGLNYVINLINYDKGLRSAVENDFIQPINLSDEHDNLTFTVDGIIIDESSLVLFYTIENKGKYRFLNLASVELLNEKGENLNSGISYEGLGKYDLNKEPKIQQKINATFNEQTVLPEDLTIRVKFREIFKNITNQDKPARVNEEIPPEETMPLSPAWEITIPLDKSKFQNLKENYDINKTITIEGQKITFEKITIYPTRIGLNVAYDPSNTKKVLNFDDLKILNEKGEEWGSIVNGVTASKLDEFHEILYFQSNYFTKPQELYLKGSSIRAIDKGKAEVTIDLNNCKIINGPDGLVLKELQNTKDNYNLRFQLKINNQQDQDHAFGVFYSIFSDAAGKSYHTKRHTNSTGSINDKFSQIITLALPNEEYKSPLTFSISDYPNHIMGNFEVKLK